MSLHAAIGVERCTFGLDVDLEAAAGSVVAVLGANGAGKSTLLDAVAGSLAIDRGTIALGGRVLDAVEDGKRRTFVPPHRRRVATVPQDVSLFPHLSVADNIAFGPRASGSSTRDARAVADRWLERLGLRDRGPDRPDALSGGQAQRVALARALATEPDALLLDEPLAALDASTRQEVRRDLGRWLATFEGVAVLVTHDPLDALLLADHVVVLEDGRVSQADRVREVAARPRTPYVADLLGTNLVRGTADGRTVTVGDATVTVAEPADGDVLVTISPRAITVHRDRPAGSARNRWRAPVQAIDLLGDRVVVHTGGALGLVAEVTPGAVADLGLTVGDDLWLAVKATDLAAYPV